MKTDQAEPKLIRAAQYVRMSTDMQKYSTENQIAAIAIYAARHGIGIVKTYLDAAKSGLTIKRRFGLQQLINDVRSAKPEFETVLVYDVSRWGRFQDADESAYYEFVCREAGVSIQYCAEEFENDGSVGATIIKAVKRAMAAEYSRELSNRVFAGKCRMTMRGFLAGGRGAYGLRRMLVDERGVAKSILQDGQRKFLHTDRTVLVPGPSEEVEAVRWIFDQYVSQKTSMTNIARSLNARGVPNINRSQWNRNTVHTVLANEKYIGNNVFNRSSIRLKSRRVNLPPEQWIRAKGVFEPLIEEGVFEAAQARLANNLDHFTQFELLDNLTAVWCCHGRLSAWELNNSPMCPGHTTFRRLFGSLSRAFQAVGYRQFSRRQVYDSVGRTVTDAIIADVGASEGIAERAGQTGVLVDGEITISIHLAYGHHKNSRGRSRWRLQYGARRLSDIMILAPFDSKRRRIIAYYLVPGFLLADPPLYLYDTNSVEIEAFKSLTLKPLIRLLRRAPMELAVAHQNPERLLFSSHSSKSLRFRSNGGRLGAGTLLYRFERRGRRVAAFVARCIRFIEAGCSLQRDLGALLNDCRFRNLLADEGLHTLPSLLHKRLYGMTQFDLEYDTPPLVDQTALHGLALDRRCRHLSSERLLQVQQMRTAFADSSPTFAKLLVAASKPNEFLKGENSTVSNNTEQAQVLELFRPIEDSARALLPYFVEEAYCYALIRACIRKLRGNDRILSYIRASHPKIYRRLLSSSLRLGNPPVRTHMP